MSRLKVLQESFQQYLLCDDSLAIAEQVVSTSTMPAIKRLAIYSDAYHARLVEALASSFPFLQSYLGEEDFHALAHSYIAQYPSTYRSIRWYGDQLPDFLSESEWGKTNPACREMAYLDWLMTIVFDSQDASIAGLEHMAAIPPEKWPDLHFQLHPSVHHHRFHWNVVEYWNAQMNEDNSIQLGEYPEPVDWLFWRFELDNHFKSMSKEESCALIAAKDGVSFGEICERLCEYREEESVAMAAAGMLKEWILSGIISDIKGA